MTFLRVFVLGGYKCGIHLSGVGSGLGLLITPTKAVFNMPCVAFGNIGCCIFRTSGNKSVTICACDRSFTGTGGLMYVSLDTIPRFNVRRFDGAISPSRGSLVGIGATIGGGLVSFCGSCPRYRITICCGAPVDGRLGDTLCPPLRTTVGKGSRGSTTGVLVSFIRGSFRCRASNRRFKCRGPFFVSRGFCCPTYSYRSQTVLFSGLIGSLLKLSTILLSCPGRVTSTMQFGRSVSNSCVLLSNGGCLVYSPACVNTPVKVYVSHFGDMPPRVVH